MSSVAFKGEPARLGDVVDADEVPELLAVFEDDRTFAVQQS
jgi:hypothetical protein